MQLWIAEGFVEKNELKSLEDVAEDYVMALISRSLILVAKEKSTGGVKTCRIHDLLHQFCVAKAKEENFLLLIHGYNELFSFVEPHNLRRLCIYSQPKDFVKSKIFFPRIRSLLFSTESGKSYEHFYNLSFVFCLKLLRVLDLGQINLGSVFPSEIAMLVHLRYLAVLGWMKEIPSSIAYLLNLETLLVTAYNGKFSLPDTIWSMQKLRHLHVTGVLFDLSLAKSNLENSLVLYNLDSFSTPRIYLGQSIGVLMKKFPNVRNLKCSLSESNASVGASHKIVVMDFLSRLESLELILHRANMHDVVFHFPLILKKLTLRGFSWSIISTIAKLPNLEVLKLFNGGQDGVTIWEMEEGEFPKLKFLKLEYLDIVGWTGSGEHFPCLQKLVLVECEKLEELPCCLGYISTLELIEVRWCQKSLVSSVRKIEEEYARMGNVDLKIFVLENIEEELSM
ncbi:hypothetical protein ACH5RR_021272 [Cinchona calisaya]|uniref:Uncharacterized protein n=1 Tax=Cinchona calisaya TaxID=153742 RepID=A0ABD2ZH12_9GENT